MRRTPVHGARQRLEQEGYLTQLSAGASSAIRADWRQAARRLAAVIDVVGERGTWR